VLFCDSASVMCVVCSFTSRQNELVQSGLSFSRRWVVAPCSVVVGYQHFGGPPHYTAQEPIKP
jgi:hypothetical protein